jgi:hypothetical protein
MKSVQLFCLGLVSMLLCPQVKAGSCTFTYKYLWGIAGISQTYATCTGTGPSPGDACIDAKTGLTECAAGFSPCWGADEVSSCTRDENGLTGDCSCTVKGFVWNKSDVDRISPSQCGGGGGYTPYDYSVAGANGYGYWGYCFYGFECATGYCGQASNTCVDQAEYLWQQNSY